MRALLTKGAGHLDIIDIPRPAVAQKSLLLRPLYVGLCFSDMHAYLDDNWSMRKRGAGLILGHEGSAEVLAVPDDLKNEFKVGQRVVINPVYSCGECLMCRAGYRTLCNKKATWFPTMCTEVFTAPPQCCFPVPDRVSDLAAAQVEPFAIGTRAVRHSGTAIGDNVVLLGLDDYNTAALQWVKVAGAGSVIAVDPIKVRRDLATRLGADVTVDPNSAAENGTDVWKSIKDAMPFGPDVVFVSTEMYIPESLQYLAAAIRMARFGATIVIVRPYYANDNMQNFPARQAWNKEVSIRFFGSHYGEEPWRGGKARGDYMLTLEELARGRINGELPATRIVPWAELNTAADAKAVFDLYPQHEAKIFFKF